MDKSVLKNGLEVITYKQQSEFVTVNYIVKSGGNDEPNDKRGVAHLVEHMLFKGTETRTAKDINTAVDIYGGELNAYTSNTATAYHCTILNEHWGVALDLLSDLIFNNAIPEDEFKSEKLVVIEELKMYNDSPSDRSRDLMTGTIFENYENRKNIGGTVDTVRALTRDDVLAFIDNFYVPTNMQLIVVGDVDHEVVVAAANDLVGGYELTDVVENYRTPADADKLVIEDRVDYMDVSQADMYVYTAFKCEPTLKQSIVMEVAAYVLGGGLGSRLGEVREKYGYCYSISMSFDEGFDVITGMIHIGLDPANVDDARRIINEILDTTVADGVSEDEFMRGVNNVKSSAMRMFAIPWRTSTLVLIYAENNIICDEAEYVATLDAITIDDVNEFIKNRLSSSNFAAAIVNSKK